MYIRGSTSYETLHRPQTVAVLNLMSAVDGITAEWTALER